MDITLNCPCKETTLQLPRNLVEKNRKLRCGPCQERLPPMFNKVVGNPELKSKVCVLSKTNTLLEKKQLEVSESDIKSKIFYLISLVEKFTDQKIKMGLVFMITVFLSVFLACITKSHLKIELFGYFAIELNQKE